MSNFHKILYVINIPLQLWMSYNALKGRKDEARFNRVVEFLVSQNWHDRSHTRKVVGLAWIFSPGLALITILAGPMGLAEKGHRPHPVGIVAVMVYGGIAFGVLLVLLAMCAGMTGRPKWALPPWMRGPRFGESRVVGDGAAQQGEAPRAKNVGG